jgi:hypothetical protein
MASDFDVSGDGSIEGYAAYAGNCDSHGDVIDRGAFADTIANAKRTGKMPFMMLQHADGPALEDALPLGVWNHMHEDSNGLVVRGRLALDNSRAADTHALIRAGALDGLSIGYVAKRFSILPKGGDVRRKLHSIDLREISIVHRPSNDSARITRFKKASTDDPVLEALQRLADSFSEEDETKRDIERALHRGGMSIAASKRLAARFN